LQCLSEWLSLPYQQPSGKLQAAAAGRKQKKNTSVAEPVFLAVFSGKIEEIKNERKLVIPV
jgi:hypothetical protein